MHLKLGQVPTLIISSPKMAEEVLKFQDIKCCSMHDSYGFRQKLDKCFHEFDKFYESVIQEHLEPSRPRLDHEDIADILIALSKDETGPLRLSKDDIKDVFMNVYRPLNNCPGRSSELFMQQDRDEQAPEEISCRNLTKALCSKVRIKLCREVTNIHVEKCWIA
ncbi:hypothetical protein POM88_036736 [Heracleum sosnowskyi]|uniref:Uncharacterized protein n=1 Tax=Heracleum sosnowskyi TaxID=360622 RepID=A0AAD8HNX5_9APIA|nr:hypothetical protein POM88_036736 [Heracleum sosnowskyi]